MGRSLFGSTISCKTPTASFVTAPTERPAELEDHQLKS